MMLSRPKRGLDERETGHSLDHGSSPAKRLRMEDFHAGSQDALKGVESPAQIDEPNVYEYRDDDEAIEITPAPVVDDLYLETVWRFMGLF